MRSKEGHSAIGLLTMMTIFVAGAIVFMAGFFPISIARVNDEDLNILPNLTDLTQSENAPTLLYNHTILMLVDALRYDFPTKTTMPFTIESACGQLKIRVNLPTVTMPRLKSLTTGTVSNFIDIVFNLGHEEKVENSILQGMRAKNYNTIFAGDRTWVELFPNLFHRKTPNIDSFFVNDFYEGDENVTRILKSELQNNDWQLFILHYLGLDHIGHVEGSESLKIPLKLQEMDNSIKQIYDAKHFRSQLVLLTGDHGMRNGGGHGGASWEEMHVPLLYFKENCIKKSAKNAAYNQIDVAPTLAILMGIDIPKNSIGCLVPELLEDLSNEDQLKAFARNAKHLVNRIGNKYGLEYVKSNDFFNWLIQAQNLHTEYINRKIETNMNSVVLFEEIKMEYIRASNEMSSQLSASLVNFDYESIIIGITIVILITLNVLMTLVGDITKQRTKHNQIKQIFYISIAGAISYSVLRFLQYIETSSFAKCCILICSLFLIIYLFLKLLKICAHIRWLSVSMYLHQLSVSQFYLLTCYIFSVCSLASSSFIEYEEKTWYYLGCSIFIQLIGTIIYKTICKKGIHINNVINHLVRELCNVSSYIIVMLILTIAPRYHKFTLTETQISLMLSLGLILIAIQLFQLTSHIQFGASVICLFCIYAIRIKEYEKHIAILLTAFWICICSIALFSFIALSKKPRILLLRGTFTCLVIIAALLHKPQNVILLPIMLFTLQSSYKLCDHLKTNENSIIILTKVLLTIFVGKIFYFCQGNTNSLATIDLNPGYIGQSSYNPTIVFIFVALNTYCAPLIAFLYLILQLTNALDFIKLGQQYVSQKHRLLKTLYLYEITILLPTTIYMCLLVSLRFHLFIYSVFAPKIFYEVFNVFIHYFALAIINCIL